MMVEAISESRLNIHWADGIIDGLCEILVIMLLIFPFHFQWVKLGIGIMVMVLALLSKNFYISRQSYNWTIAYVVLSLLLIGHGLIARNPAPLLYFPTYVLWPIYYMLLTGCITRRTFSKIIKTGKLCLVVNILIGIAAFFKINFPPNPGASFWFYEAAIRPGFPFLAITSANITCFIFSYFFFAPTLMQKDGKVKKIDWIIFLLGFVYIFMTSRRAIFLCVVLWIIMEVFFMRFVSQSDKKILSRKFFKGIAYVSVLLLAVVYLGFFSMEDMQDFFEKTGQASDNPRREQIEALLAGWREAPLFGAGTGVDAAVSRSDNPGTYELTYLAKLFEGGLFGITYYFLLIYVLYKWLIRLIKRNPALRTYGKGTLVAVTMLLIVNGTNPYLGAFDFMWILYMPFMLINMERRETVPSRVHRSCQSVGGSMDTSESDIWR